MGVDAVEYHRATVLGRSDDNPGRALAYYGSRGETPLVWGGKLAPMLGLAGGVDDASYDAIFGRGGARRPQTGERLASTRRPGAELVVSPDKSVSLLGVIGRADDMHAIVDAETRGTLAYLERWFERQGGRRGRAQQRSATSGLLWARTRHATTRAGDPLAHDHVLIANLSQMLDRRGGWKGADTAAIRDVNHAATMAGRVEAAAEAVRRGYAIEPAHGPSGKLDSWRLAGIPAQACEILSKRSAQIDDALERSGFDSYRARNVVAHKGRDTKVDDGADQLVPRWQAELAEAGWPVERIAERLRRVNQRAMTPEPMTGADLEHIAAAVLDADGALGKYKAFTYDDAVRHTAHHLYGQDPRLLDETARAVIDHHDTVRLIGAPTARGRAYVAASVLDAEMRVAATAERLANQEGVRVSPDVLTTAVSQKQDALGRSLTDSQHRAVTAVASAGRGLDVILGVAGAGKTTALDVLRAAYEGDGYTVLGTATSGQAAHTLTAEANVEARTIASLLHRLQDGTVRLDGATVLLVDEAGMTDDRDLLAVLLAAERAKAKVVLIGDHRQLGAVDPGGSLEALVHRHSEAVHVLDENVRQADPGERAALAALRDGNVAEAVEWYAANDRVRVAPSRADLIDHVVDRWLADTLSGDTTLLLAWRRADVAALNAAARQAWRAVGRLGDDEIVSGGRRNAVGDRVVALQPLHEELRTSQRATVTAVHPDGIGVRTDDGYHLNLHLEQMSSAHLDHAYAVTVHRAQGATVDRAHVLADGGGRELAYVAMSRARVSSHVYVVADDLADASIELREEWSTSRRERWTLDTDRPAASSAEQRPALAPRPVGIREWLAAHGEVNRLHTSLDDLRAGRGEWAATPEGDAVAQLHDASRSKRQAEEILGDGSLGWRSRRYWKRQLASATTRYELASDVHGRVVAPIEAELRSALDAAETRLRDLGPMPTHTASVADRGAGVERQLGRAAGAERDFGIEL